MAAYISRKKTMTTNITTLSINLLISERKNHRNLFAERIMELLPESSSLMEVEKILKSNFLTTMAICVENPNGEARNVFYQLAQFFERKVNGVPSDLSVAA